MKSRHSPRLAETFPGVRPKGSSVRAATYTLLRRASVDRAFTPGPLQFITSSAAG